MFFFRIIHKADGEYELMGLSKLFKGYRPVSRMTQKSQGKHKRFQICMVGTVRHIHASEAGSKNLFGIYDDKQTDTP